MAGKGTVDKFINVAEKEVGFIEGPKENQTHYQKVNQPWCGAFVNWVAKKAGVDIPNCVYTPAGATSFKSKGQWIENSSKAKPQKGDVVFFDFPNDGIERISHVGIVVSDNGDGTVTTIEGNTTHDRKGDQRNGGEVCIKIRAFKKNKKNLAISVVGFGRPEFKAVAESPKVCPTCGRGL